MRRLCNEMLHSTTILFTLVMAYLQQDYQTEHSKVDGQINTIIPNPLALNLYTCGYDNKKTNII